MIYFIVFIVYFEALVHGLILKKTFGRLLLKEKVKQGETLLENKSHTSKQIGF